MAQFKIGSKFILLLSTLLLLAALSVNWITSSSFQSNNLSLIRDINREGAANLSYKSLSLVNLHIEKAKTLGKNLIEKNDFSQELLKSQFFKKNPSIKAVFIVENNGSKDSPSSPSHFALRESLTKSTQASSQDLFKQFTKEKSISSKELAQGLKSASLYKADKNNYLLLSAPLIRSGNQYSHSLLVLTDLKIFQKAMQQVAGVSGYLISSKGELVAQSPDLNWTLGDSTSDRALVQAALESEHSEGHLSFKDSQTKQAKLGVFQSIGFGGLKIITEVLESRALAATNEARLKTALFTVVILCLALLVALFFSDSITNPISTLLAATKKIGEGDFETEVNIKSRDELAQLGSAFNEMAQGLKERERVKHVFNKFHSKEIAEQILSGNVKLGGEKKEVAILFCDIRDFTPMSETMQAEEVIEMLNEYLSTMVEAIQKHQGVIDKFIGDAILAVWGIPDSKADDATNAVQAALAMRQALEELNKKRVQRGESLLKIGIGIHHGEAVAGNVGSESKMEYTIIGDSVNLASRIESLTKQLSVDILVTKAVKDQASTDINFKLCGRTKVKGKSQGVEVYKVPSQATTELSREKSAA